MTATCPSCGCHQPDGLLCHEDSSALETMFAAVPELVDQLQVAISKQAKVGAAGKGGLARERSPINFGALAVRDALMVELATWAQDVSAQTWQPVGDRIVVARAKTVPHIGPFHDQCQHPTCERMRTSWVDPAPAVVVQATAYLANQIDAIRKHPAASEIVSGVGRVVKDAFRCIDRMQDRKYLGQCMADVEGETCYAEIWARPGANQTTCPACRGVHDVFARRAWLLEEAADMLFKVPEAARLMGEVGGIHVTQARIRGYIHRGRIAYKAGTMIRLGDLLAVVLDDSERKGAA